MLRDIVPWTRERELTARGDAIYPVLTLHRQMNRLFDDLARDGFDVGYPAYGPAAYGKGAVWPYVEIGETDTGYKVSAELPGLDEKDVEVLIDDDGYLTIRGDKRVEAEGADFSERMYGKFERKIALDDLDMSECAGDKCKATFKNGVLTVFLPKAVAGSRKTRRIAVNEAADQAEARPAASLRQAA
jgi:HSP20 family protein